MSRKQRDEEGSKGRNQKHATTQPKKMPSTLLMFSHVRFVYARITWKQKSFLITLSSSVYVSWELQHHAVPLWEHSILGLELSMLTLVLPGSLTPGSQPLALRASVMVWNAL